MVETRLRQLGWNSQNQLIRIGFEFRKTVDAAMHDCLSVLEGQQPIKGTLKTSAVAASRDEDRTGTATRFAQGGRRCGTRQARDQVQMMADERCNDKRQGNEVRQETRDGMTNNVVAALLEFV